MNETVKQGITRNFPTDILHDQKTVYASSSLPERFKRSSRVSGHNPTKRYAIIAQGSVEEKERANQEMNLNNSVLKPVVSPKFNTIEKPVRNVPKPNRIDSSQLKRSTPVKPNISNMKKAASQHDILAPFQGLSVKPTRSFGAKPPILTPKPTPQMIRNLSQNNINTSSTLKRPVERLKSPIMQRKSQTLKVAKHNHTPKAVVKKSLVNNESSNKSPSLESFLDQKLIVENFLNALSKNSQNETELNSIHDTWAASLDAFWSPYKNSTTKNGQSKKPRKPHSGKPSSSSKTNHQSYRNWKNMVSKLFLFVRL